jgi:hypothetical protein
MPFANLRLPSIALTQLKSILESALGEEISVEILYLNHDFAKLLGTDFYAYLADSNESLNTGLGDWFFRQLAFPELPNNSEKYSNRYFSRRNPGVQRLWELVTRKRQGIDEFMAGLISKYDLEHTQIVGFTSMFMQNTACFAMARKLKRCNPAVITTMGGANCEFPMGDVIAQRVTDIDYVFSGPALKSFPEFVGHCLARDLSNSSNIPGVFARGMPLPQPGARTIDEAAGF